MMHSYERRSQEYERWVEMLSTILLIRFGISVNDSFDEDQLANLFSCGDTPKEVAGELKRKWELIDLDNQ